MRFKWFVFLLTTLVFASEEAGRNMGQRFIESYGGERKGNKIKNKLLNPATQGGQYVVPSKDGGERALQGPPSICRQVMEEREIARGVLRKDNQRVEYVAEFYYSGQVLRWSGQRICSEGACSDNGCVRVARQGDRLVLERVQSLNSCVPFEAMPPPPGYAFGRAIQLYQEITGYSVSRTEEAGEEVRYFGGYLACRGQALANQNIPQTSYYHNPYRINDDAIYRQIYCQQRPEDPDCRASRATVNALSSYTEGEAQQRTCELRRVINPNLYSQRICEPGYRIYADGYNNTRPYCMADFFDFSAGLWLECNTDGTGYRLRGFGFREGYIDRRGRLSTDIPPSEPYPVDVPVLLDRTYSWTYAGTVRTGNGDFTVEYMNEFDGIRNAFRVRVNAPTCNSFVWTLDKPSTELFIGCEEEERNCRIRDVWWIDAHGREWQLIRNGVPVEAISGCDEVVRDESIKKWVSHMQSLQSPAGNCAYPPKTCQVVEGQTECRRWFRQRRTYICHTQARHRTDVKRLEDVFFSTRIEEDGRFSYGRSCGYVCPEGQREGNVCIRPVNAECAEGYTKFGNLCVREPECPVGTVWNRQTRRCEGTVSCSPGFIYHGQQRCVRMDIWVDEKGRPISPTICQWTERVDEFTQICWKERPRARANHTITHSDFGLSAYTGKVYFFASAEDDPYVYYEYIQDGQRRRVVLVQIKRDGYDYWSGSGNFYTDGGFTVRAEDQGTVYGYQYLRVGIELKRPSELAQCPSRTDYESSVDLCIASGSCPYEGRLNALTGMCERELNPPCPDGWLRRGSVCTISAREVCTEGGSGRLPAGRTDCTAMCVVKVRNGEYDMRECNPSCPVMAGEQLIENCTCDPRSGFGISAGAMAWISQMVKDKQCER